MYGSSICRSVSLIIAAHISSIDVHIRMSTVILILCMLTFIPVISLSLLSVWLLWDNQSSLHYLGPDLFKMHTIYFWMCSMVDCNCWDSVATSFLNIATNGLWFVITYTSLAKQYGWKFSNPCNMPSASCLMLLHHHSVLDRLLLVNAIGHKGTLSGISSHPQFIPSLAYNNLAPGLIWDASVCRYSGFIAS